MKKKDITHQINISYNCHWFPRVFYSILRDYITANLIQSKRSSILPKLFLYMWNHVTLLSDSNFIQNKSKDVMMAPGPLQHLLVPSSWHLYAKIQSAPTCWSPCSPVWHISTWGPFHLTEIVSFRHLCDSIFFKSLSISNYWMKSTLMMLNRPPVCPPLLLLTSSVYYIM